MGRRGRPFGILALLHQQAFFPSSFLLQAAARSSASSQAQQHEGIKIPTVQTPLCLGKDLLIAEISLTPQNMIIAHSKETGMGKKKMSRQSQEKTVPQVGITPIVTGLSCLFPYINTHIYIKTRVHVYFYPSTFKCFFIPLALQPELLEPPTLCVGSGRMERPTDIKQVDLQQATPRAKMRFGK